MAEKDWRMPAMCESCPFSNSPGGTRQRKALRPGRMASIKAGLRRGLHFFCHKTATGEETDDGGYLSTGQEKYCAGALAYEDSLGISTNYRRVCESLDYFAEQRKKNKEKTGA